MASALHVELARCATARAHLAGAEAADLEARAREVDSAWPPTLDEAIDNKTIADDLARTARSARRRYWREVATAQALTIGSLPAAEQSPAAPAPAGGLVERVANVFLTKTFTADDPVGARAAILACASWLRSVGSQDAACELEAEVSGD